MGWDISTSVVGCTILDDQGEFVSADHLDFKNHSKLSLIEKVEKAEDFVGKMIEEAHAADSNGSGIDHYVEDRLGNFAAGRTMLQTLMKLAAFNLAFSYMIVKVSDRCDVEATIQHIHPSSVKSLLRPEGLVVPKGGDKKKITLKFVKDKVPLFPMKMTKNGNPQPFCYDMADSFITARAGYLRKNAER